ncbi:MAG: hypothetical protein LBU12_06515 [Deltaproteobacteria bacterium]|jgi:hypothetical protein|nr:hypothetical protein [Deltaproteobacteria bacterium]
MNAGPPHKRFPAAEPSTSWPAPQAGPPVPPKTPTQPLSNAAPQTSPKKPPSALESRPAASPAAAFDRRSYLKDIRENLLVKIGLPPGAKPERIANLLKIQMELNKLNSSKH